VCQVLVTGASGLIGSHVVRVLLQAGYRPRAFSRRPLPPELEAVEHVRGDVRDRRTLQEAMDGTTGVIHTAALYSYDRADSAEMLSTNVEGTRTVLDAARASGVPRVVVTSSAATCGPVRGRAATEHDTAPEWELAVPYKQSKVTAEQLALERAHEGQDVVVVNPTTTVGAWDRRPTPSGHMILDVLQRRIRGYISSGGLNVVAAWDVAAGHVLALERGRSGERYLLGGEDLTMREAFALIARLGGVPVPRVAVPYRPVLGCAWLVDVLERRLGREPQLMNLDEVRLARLPMYFSSAKAASQLGYSARGAEEALAVAVDWFERFRLQRPQPSPLGRGRLGRRVRQRPPGATPRSHASATAGPGASAD
jgi:dihydroflavonol-4-reductase